MSDNPKISAHAGKKGRQREFRSEKLTQVTAVVGNLEPRLSEKIKHLQQLNLLDSVSHGLYDEVDKLCKKAPVEPVTDLVLGQLNDLIKETKQLIVSDVYVQRLSEFVAAGDNPQQRDAVIVLRQIRQGLERFEEDVQSQISNLRHTLNEAGGIQLALQIYLQSGEPVTEEILRDNGEILDDRWLGGTYSNKYFDFDELDGTDLIEYFTGA